MRILILIFLVITSSFCFAQRRDAVLYLSTDRLPRLKKSNIDIYDLIHKKIIWPKEIDAEGTVLVSFIVTKKGELIDIRIESSLIKEFDDEAIRVLKLLPKWIPGKKKGKKVDVIIYMPIQFKITE